MSFNRHINQHVAPRNEDALTMIRAKKLRRGAAVWTADEHNIGETMRLHHRQEGVNPDLKFYGCYLELSSIELGGDAYIPIDFIHDYDPADNKLTLAVTLKEINKEAWNQTPLFVAHNKATVELLLN